MLAEGMKSAGMCLTSYSSVCDDPDGAVGSRFCEEDDCSTMGVEISGAGAYVGKL